MSNPFFFRSVLFVFRLVHCVYLLQRRDVLPNRWIPSMMVRPFHYLLSGHSFLYVVFTLLIRLYGAVQWAKQFKDAEKKKLEESQSQS